ncbi:MAG: N-acetylmuramoyl-L-alanine amidase [Pseudoflavonifractor capillosus]|uniref:peptidoglycan recognition protein family protein n=1 Tax=Pseudoflavonifractor capillosus TaxID=106588 RepID=UPI0023F7758E|nr:N-acetylmuramoyl-L-alanine amidase [Pseudoflavonifractor capillosus]MCI5929306.1 N-acetylmuramoyl-L-alanine amidase [Pseudoflavonifractor capillosus]MDY4661273.1 N-acetylmuramoyl-L-alanine amidase [Pseudoflavonifractor capillosus]
MDQLTWQQIQQKTGCCALCNLWYFDMRTYQHDVGVMLEGKWARQPEYDWPGICIDRDGQATTGGTADAVWYYAASVQADYTDGKRTNTTYWPKDGVTYTGLTARGDVVILLSPEDSPMDSEEAVHAMLDAGCTDILRWDGSWSSQGSLGPGMDVQPSQCRICRGWLLVFERETNKEVKPVDEITESLMTNSACYKAGRTITPKGIMVHSTAAPGVMADQLRNSWNSPQATAAVHAMVDDTQTLQTLPWTCRGWHAGAGSGGKTANDTHISIEICEPNECRLLPVEWVPLYQGNSNNPAWAVKRLQMELQARGHDPKGVDGSFGPGCKVALMAYQKDAGLDADGSCGPATLATLAAREDSYLKYDPEETADYFAAVWNRTVALCAKLCCDYQLDPMTDIICHAEGYRQGIATNHADVEHWWPEHGKTMDQFRADVKAAMSGEVPQEPDEPQQPETDKPADWAARSWEKVSKKIGTDGKPILDGTRPEDSISRQELAVVLDRLGLLD